jgi:hypothetical protein
MEQPEAVSRALNYGGRFDGEVISLLLSFSLFPLFFNTLDAFSSPSLRAG